VIEAANALIKTWKALRDVFPNNQIPYIGDYIKIVYAFCNAIGSPRTHKNPDDHLVTKRILLLASQPNKLQKRAEKGW